jgi:hypothetical protein
MASRTWLLSIRGSAITLNAENHRSRVSMAGIVLADFKADC